jgi:hypothetical protein
MRDPTTGFLLAASFLLVAYGAVVLLGHIIDLPLLYAPLPPMIGMAPTTALLFVICGLCFWLISRSRN